ncbi:hypothetical protein RhiirC2_793613 [Rhizophagus irregularis]|uniref:Uncharacterized protein n=1 Tax=Rhizophagus irregularis TaxID=588596 RepID=A0A2N1MF31_9GLOM|nr:hypothetical protein RhiirC2_793613 [Rhizophagus irregularis]
MKGVKGKEKGSKKGEEMMMRDDDGDQEKGDEMMMMMRDDDGDQKKGEEMTKEDDEKHERR